MRVTRNARRRTFTLGLRLVILAAALVLEDTNVARCQELEPRSYSAAPVDSNFAVGAVSNSTGTVPVDPTLPLSDVRPSINTVTLSFTHTFRLGGRTANWAVAIPYLGGRINATAAGQPETLSRVGFADLRGRFGINLLGPALTPSDFACRKPSTTLGLSMTVIMPTGTYDRRQFINVGSNRWTFKPEIGLEQPMGKWFADLSAGLWVFGENVDYFGGQVLRQAPLGIFQFHTGYTFRQNQWLAIDANYYSGGATQTGGGASLNSLANSRYGLTFSQPVGSGLSTKVSWSRWLSGRFGQRFSTIGLALQYLWFDHH
jgi:hypothetical protein